MIYFLRYWKQIALVLACAYFLIAAYGKGAQHKEAEWTARWATYEKQVTADNLAHEQEIRKIQTELQSTADRVNKDAKQQIDKLENDLLAANASAGSLRDKVTQYAARAKKCASDTGTATGSQTADAPAVVLGRMFSWADQSAGELAEFADRSRIAGLACESAYDEIRWKLMLESK